jgi:hypothetical protein
MENRREQFHSKNIINKNPFELDENDYEKHIYNSGLTKAARVNNQV